MRRKGVRGTEQVGQKILELKKAKTKYRDVNALEPENKMKAAWEGGKWVCVPLPQSKREERREGGERRWRSVTRQ